MVALFREKRASAVIGLVVISIVIRSHHLFQPVQVITSEQDGLLFYLLQYMQSFSPLLLTCIFHAVIIIQALRYNYLLNDLRLFQVPAFTTALAYILCTAILPQWNHISAALFANGLVILLIHLLLKLYNAPNTKTQIFNAGLVAGVAVILYIPSFPLLIIAFLALAILRSFRLNEWLILLMGILAPAYFICGWLYLSDKLVYIQKGISYIHITPVNTGNLLLPVVALCTVLLIIIAGIILWQNNSGRMVIQIRKSWFILFISLVLLAPGVFFFNNAWPLALLLSTVPAAAFISNAFLNTKQAVIRAIYFWLMIAIIIYMNWMYIK